MTGRSSLSAPEIWGRALLGYKGFSHQGFRIVAAFDVDPKKVGTMIEGVSVLHLDALADVVQRNEIKLGLIAVPATTAQTVSDRLVAAGVEGIVNFAPGHTRLATRREPGRRSTWQSSWSSSRSRWSTARQVANQPDGRPQRPARISVLLPRWCNGNTRDFGSLILGSSP